LKGEKISCSFYKLLVVVIGSSLVATPQYSPLEKRKKKRRESCFQFVGFFKQQSEYRSGKIINDKLERISKQFFVCDPFKTRYVWRD
jgi:glutathione peroxidase-family protein